MDSSKIFEMLSFGERINLECKKQGLLLQIQFEKVIS